MKTRDIITTNNTTSTRTKPMTALERLKGSLAPAGQGSLLDRVRKAQEEQANPAVLLLDVSGSMAEYCEPGRRKIDALRQIVAGLRAQGLLFRQVVFSSKPQVTDTIPEPNGSTAMHLGIDMARGLNPRKLVLVTDGMPDSESLALAAASRLNCPIDIFYVGPGDPHAEDFLRRLAQASGGQYGKTDLATGAPQLQSKLAGLLGRG